MLNGGSAVGRVLPNMLASRIGVFNVVIPCVAISGILVFCSLAVKDVAGTVVFALLYGFFSGACKSTFHFLRVLSNPASKQTLAFFRRWLELWQRKILRSVPEWGFVLLSLVRPVSCSCYVCHLIVTLGRFWWSPW
jgi:hypothetical protein